MDFTNAVGRRVGRHFVTLSCEQTAPKLTAPRTWVFSGFVIEILGEWFYVTAGHILRDVETAIEAHSSFGFWRFGDQAAGDEETRRRHKHSGVPYDFDIAGWYVLRDDELGLDYAVTHVSLIYRLQLEAGGVLPFTKDMWLDYPNSGSVWGLAGVPKESVVHDGVSIIDAKFTLLGATPTTRQQALEQRPPISSTRGSTMQRRMSLAASMV